MFDRPPAVARTSVLSGTYGNMCSPMARAKRREQQAARVLRSRGWSLRRIANELDVSLTSASVWVRDVPMPAFEERVIEASSTEPSAETGLRRCSRCAQVLPLDRFNRHGSGRQWWCRECFSAYFRARGAIHRQQTREAELRRQRAAREFIRRHLATQRCADCGEADVRVIEFDHLGAKRGDISKLVGVGLSLRALKREIAGCEAVCVNCHRRRTARRAKWRKAASNWRSVASARTKHEAARVEFAYGVLERSGCTDCGSSELCVLEFDHIREKRAHVIQLARSGCSQERLEIEIAACEVRCANCHRRRTHRQHSQSVPLNL